MMLMGSRERHKASEHHYRRSTLVVEQDTPSSFVPPSYDVVRKGFSIFTDHWSLSICNFPVAWLFDYTPIVLNAVATPRRPAFCKTLGSVFRRSIIPIAPAEQPLPYRWSPLHYIYPKKRYFSISRIITRPWRNLHAQQANDFCRPIIFWEGQ